GVAPTQRLPLGRRQKSTISEQESPLSACVDCSFSAYFWTTFLPLTTTFRSVKFCICSWCIYGRFAALTVMLSHVKSDNFFCSELCTSKRMLTTNVTLR